MSESLEIRRKRAGIGFSDVIIQRMMRKDGYYGNLLDPNYVHEFVVEHGLVHTARLRNAKYDELKSNSLLRTFSLPFLVSRKRREFK